MEIIIFVLTVISCTASVVCAVTSIISLFRQK